MAEERQKTGREATRAALALAIELERISAELQAAKERGDQTEIARVRQRMADVWAEGAMERFHAALDRISAYLGEE